MMISTRAYSAGLAKPNPPAVKVSVVDYVSDSDSEDYLTAELKSPPPLPSSSRSSLPRHISALCSAAEITADVLHKLPGAVVETASNLAADVVEATPTMITKALIAMTVLLSLYFEGMLQSSITWSIAVAYVSANHFVYGVHHLLGASGWLPKSQQDYVIGAAGMGKILKSVESLGVWGFDEHRIADCAVHAGMLLLLPWRLDHWVELFAHVLKYGGVQVSFLEKVVVGDVLTVGDFVDVFAHVVSGCYFLGLWHMLLAIATAEFVRLMIYFNVLSWSHKICGLPAQL